MDRRRICDGSEELRVLKERLHMAKVNKERLQKWWTKLPKSLPQALKAFDCCRSAPNSSSKSRPRAASTLLSILRKLVDRCEKRRIASPATCWLNIWRTRGWSSRKLGSTERLELLTRCSGAGSATAMHDMTRSWSTNWTSKRKGSESASR